MRSMKTRCGFLVRGAALFIISLIPLVSFSAYLQTQKPYRAIAGMSMGAYGALHYGLKYPHKFQILAGLGGPVDMRGLLAFASRTMNNYDRWSSRYFTLDDLFSMVLDLSISFGNMFYDGTDDLYPEPYVTHQCHYACDGKHLLVPAYLKDWSIPNLLAVDLNDNQVFDYGEPLVHFLYEPYLSIDSNGWRDAYEHFEDVGLDGIPNTGDYGEGNGHWDYDPDVGTLLTEDPYLLLDQLSNQELAGLNIYLDAGDNDDFDFDLLNDRFAELLSSRDSSVLRVPSGLLEFPSFEENHAYFRYPGDHVGLPNPLMLKQRLTHLMSFVSTKLPGGHFGNVRDVFYPSTLTLRVFDSEALDREGIYGLYLPPGYERRKEDTYSVIYFLTGYGSRLDRFVNGWLKMLLDTLVYTRVLEKSIIVFLDGSSENGLGGRSSFYVNQVHPDGEDWEDYITEVMEHIDQFYRTKSAEVIVQRWY